MSAPHDAPERAEAAEAALTNYLDETVRSALADPDIALSMRHATAQPEWLIERVISARASLVDATRVSLDRYVEALVSYEDTYDEYPQPWSVYSRQRSVSAEDLSALEAWEVVLQRLGVWRSRLRTAVEEEIAEAIGDWLRDRPGGRPLELAVAHDPGFTAESRTIAQTDDARKFQGVCNENPTDAIGLAGPRGCGKTTLLTHSLRSGSPPNYSELRVLVPAPVRYEARDFLLYVFAELCRSVVRERYPQWWSMFPGLRRGFPIDSVARPAAWAAYMYGASLLLTAAWNHDWLEPLRQSGRYFAALWDWLWLPRGPFLDYPLHLSLTALLVAGAAASILLSTRRGFDWVFVTRVGRDIPAVVASANRHLESIRTLASATTIGMNGELGTKGIKFTANRAVQRSIRTWSFPELASEMKEFLAEVESDADHREVQVPNTLARGLGMLIQEYVPWVTDRPDEVDQQESMPPRKHRIVLVIDELDKIDSTEDVQRFINEIKVIFDAPALQVIVSVSEDALANFELRGLPVRDAFDSAFQHVVRIGYLSIADTRRILERTALPALSRPFVWLVYCLSGGLPRDVIRVGAELQAIARARPGEHLKAVCEYLVRQDLQRRLPAFEQACSDVLRKGGTGSESQILTLVREIRRIASGRQSYHPEELIASVPVLTTAVGVGSLGRQTGAYLYYCATVLDVLAIDHLSKPEEDNYKKLLPTLVESRQAMAVHPDLAIELIEEFRASWGLPQLTSDLAD